MANQFTKAEEEGREKPPGANQFTTGKRERHDQATKDKMRAEHAARKLQSILDAEDSTKDQVIAAAKALLPYGKSTYSSIEQKEVNEWDQMSEEEVQDMVRALITAHPGLLELFKPGVRAVEQVCDATKGRNTSNEHEVKDATA